MIKCFLWFVKRDMKVANFAEKYITHITLVICMNYYQDESIS